MAYIVVLNPLILGASADKDGAQLPITQVAAATALVAGVMTILMGVVARFPLALAAGLGINALVAYEIAPKMTWADAMGLVVIEGVIITLLVLTGLRTAVFHAVPAGLKTAIAAGIGLFLVLIGLVDAGFVRRVPDAAGTTVPVGLGVNGRLLGWPILVFVFALVLTIILLVRRVKGAILIGIVSAADPGHRHRGGGQDRALVHRRRTRATRPAGASTCRPCRRPTRSSGCPTSACSASSTCSARGRPPAGWSR